MPPSRILLGIALLLAVLLPFTPAYLLFLARYPLVMFQQTWSVAGVLVDSLDLVLGCLLLAYLFRKRTEVERLKNLPYMMPWLALGLLLSLSYLTAPGAQEYLTAPHRIIYQLYRYGWRTIVFFPLALILLNSETKVRHALIAVVLAGDLAAVQATIEGYTAGVRASGPFSTPNGLAGGLVAPMLISLFGLLVPRARHRLFCFASFVLMTRAMLFSGSRGGTTAVTAGLVFTAAWLLTRKYGRARLGRLVPAALVAFLVVLAIKPDLFERPTIRRAMTARQGTAADTLQWRMQERWPRFLETIRENPWLGTGTDVDPEFATIGGAATPHNGYLAVAVANGIPAAVLYFLMAFLALRNGLRLFAHAGDPQLATMGLVLASAILGLLVHNLVDATIRIPFARDLFWMICALSAPGASLRSPARSAVPSIAKAKALAQGPSP